MNQKMIKNFINKYGSISGWDYRMRGDLFRKQKLISSKWDGTYAYRNSYELPVENDSITYDDHIMFRIYSDKNKLQAELSVYTKNHDYSGMAPQCTFIFEIIEVTQLIINIVSENIESQAVSSWEEQEQLRKLNQIQSIAQDIINSLK